jgi:hypothetical protein
MTIEKGHVAITGKKATRQRLAASIVVMAIAPKV